MGFEIPRDADLRDYCDDDKRDQADEQSDGARPGADRPPVRIELTGYRRSRKEPSSTSGHRRIAVGGSAARCHGCDSCMSVTVSHSSDRSAAGFPVDCSLGRHRCGPTPMRGAGPTTRWLRHRSRSSPTERRRDTAECSDPGGRRSAHRRIRANVSYWCRAGPTPDMHCCSRPSGCAST